MDVRIEEAPLSELEGIPGRSVMAGPEWLAGMAPFVDAELNVLACRSVDRTYAWFPHWVRRRLSISTVVTPYPFYYSPLILHLPDRKRPQERARSELTVVRALAADLKKRYHRVQVNLPWNLTDVRGFQWEGYTALPRYTLLNTPGDLKLEQITPTHRTPYRRALREGLQFVRTRDPRVFTDLTVASYQRQRKAIPISREKLHGAIAAALGLPFTEGFAVTDGDRPLAAGIVVVDTPLDTAFAWMAGFDPGSSQGAGVFLFFNMLDAMKESCKLFDMCGANTPLIAQYKAGFGGTLTPFYHIKYSRLRIR